MAYCEACQEDHPNDPFDPRMKSAVMGCFSKVAMLCVHAAGAIEAEDPGLLVCILHELSGSNEVFEGVSYALIQERKEKDIIEQALAALPRLQAILANFEASLPPEAKEKAAQAREHNRRTENG